MEEHWWQCFKFLKLSRNEYKWNKLQANLKIECRSNFLWKLSIARFYIVGKVLQCSSKQLWLSRPTWCWDGSNVGIWERSTRNLVKIKDWQLAQNQVSSVPFKHTWVICGWCWMIKIVELCYEWFFGWFWENIGWERGDRWMEQDGRWKNKKKWLCVNKPQNCQKSHISNAL